ncbi:MAG TPA: LuxR C-terminal-related transcriptional regulator [Arsenophonus apicola]|uniref:helix-turn-helix transcriptional regulator n=1 Tax=Arsenophonus apicola TaxID=2879119 RepID=UPI001CDC229F|nr:helix-turn-helix transcriptional regulator [Arsenophonus apicola]UBX30875.1 helix-turn-helix transcriptional regulator [Arsenophonus apicola]
MFNPESPDKKFGKSSNSLISFIEKSTNHWHIKDIESRYIYINKSLKQALKIPNKYDIEGVLDRELPVDICQDLWPQFIETDKKAVEENKTISSIEIHCYGEGNLNNPVPRFVEKTPLCDDNNKVIGTVCYGRMIEIPTLLYYMNRLNRKTIQFDAPNDTFTKRELEVIFWAQQRLSAKEIAQRLDISHKTVEGHFKLIYKKADVHSIFQLIEYCKHTGLDRYIPIDFIRKGVQLIN